MPTEITSLSSREFDLSHGYHGFRLIDSEFTPVSGEKYSYLVPKGGAATVTATNERGGDDLSGESLDQGFPVPGLFSSVSVSSGTVIAFIAGPNEN